jgi:lipid II:glycine glycyltransferase (peptidoglycan interpeptide bridge formation enzyme)
MAKLDVFGDCHYLQSLDWYKSHPESLLVTSMNDGDVTARSVVRLKNLPLNLGMLVFIDRGPVAKNKHNLVEHLEHLKAYFKTRKCICIQCSPISYNDDEIIDITTKLTQTNWKKIEKTLSLYKSTVVIPLDDDIGTIKSQFRRSLKTQLNKSERLGITINAEPEDSQIQEFIHYHNIMARKRGLAEISDNTADYLIKSIANRNTKLLLAYLDDKLISGAALVIQGYRVIYEWGMNTLDPQLKSLPLAHKMHWEAIKWSKENDFKIYDMGGYWLSEGSDNSINQFKLGFSKYIENVMPEFYFVVDHFRFSLFSFLLKLRGYLK